MIYTRLRDEFNDDELALLANDMGWQHESIWSADDKHEARAIALVTYAARRGELARLLDAIARARPNK